ncbi:hypothetical protein [Clostridium paraputrificum]|uniref:hypothetical protein n=1 Tax=Clostridium paraputrificum TaxID=29363 RepID=UPI00189F87E6|nr:hypothetical protein [Clostridium paraputrificum]
MKWDINNIEDIVSYINQALSNGKTMVSIEQEVFGVNERVIHKRLLRLNYKKIDNQYRLQEGITSKITPSKKHYKATEEVKNTINDIIPIEENAKPIKVIEGVKDIDKLNLLLENIDSLLKLIPTNITSNITTGLRSEVNDVKSFRIDTGLYKAIKERATRDNINISHIINKALEDYLNNYL